MPVTEFVLNDQTLRLEAPRGRLLLDVIRVEAAQTGTKEGCREGDCGACTVLIGRPGPERVDYEVVTSCLVPLGEVQGCHVVTVEGVSPKVGLSPIQDAFVRHGGTQCGYCTPGFVVATAAFLINAEAPSKAGFERAISGCLCRCTGYSSILRAGDELVESMKGGLLSALTDAPNRLAACAALGVVPPYFEEIGERLAGIESRCEPAPETGSTIVAGGTDLYVQRGEEIAVDDTVSLFNRYPEARRIEVVGDQVRFGALTTFSEFAACEAGRRLVPRIDEILPLLASLPIRNRATLAGNIVNASPIGDMTQILLALGAELVLRKGDALRTLPLEDFFHGYKRLDLRDGEFVTELWIPDVGPGTRFHFEKVSKRKALDISSVCGAARIESDGAAVREARITLGGVAPIPLLCRAASSALIGNEVNRTSVARVIAALEDEITPISDVRGTADYKRRLARHLVVALLYELFPEGLSAEEVKELL